MTTQYPRATAVVLSLLDAGLNRSIGPRVEQGGWSRSGRAVAAFAGVVLAAQLAVLLHGWVAGEPLHTLHWTDEFTYHLPLIDAFAAGGLASGFEDYTSATTPLFHLGFGALRAVTGLSSWGLRAVNTLFAVLAAALVFRFLARTRLDGLSVWLLSGGFAFAPYCFGHASLLMTETLAVLWFVSTLAAFNRWVRSQAPLDLWASAVLLSLAVLTRQQLLWATAWFAILTLAQPAASPRARIARLVAWTLPPLVFAPFAIAWQGLVPPAFQASNQATDLNLRGVLFAVTSLGLYAGLLAPSRLIGFARERKGAFLCAASVAVGLCVLVGMRFEARETDGGYLWRIAQNTPGVLGASGVLAGLTVVGALELTRALFERRRAYLLFVALFALSFLLVAKNFQKYYEAQLLLVVIWSIACDNARSTRLDCLGRFAWLLLCAGYLASKLVSRFT